MQDISTSQSTDLFPQARMGRQRERTESPDWEMETETESQSQLENGSSPYFTPSRRRGADDDEDSESDCGSASASKSASKGPRQGVLAFSGGKLMTKKPLINPISRNDARRKALAEIARETWTLLPGLLATRPDVTNDGYLCRKETLDSRRCPGLLGTKVVVEDMDTIDAALQIGAMNHTRGIKTYRPVAILNMANAKHAGGGWQHGAMAQEEALCYRSSLIKTLHYKHYPIPEDAAIYSPSVLIIRDTISQGHRLLDLRQPADLPVLSVISAAAVCQPFLKRDLTGQQIYRDSRDVKLMQEKMRVILRTAIRNKHTQIVLGAFGCGAFGNPNVMVAQMWRDVLREKEFAGGYWDRVVFAVLDGGSGNLKVFKAILEGIMV